MYMTYDNDDLPPPPSYKDPSYVPEDMIEAHPADIVSCLINRVGGHPLVE